MSKAKKSSDNPNQYSLLDLLQERAQEDCVARILEGELNDDARVRALLAEDIRTSSYSRPEIAGRMSHYLGHDVTRAMIDAWTATCESHDGHRFPLAWARAWCRATESDRLIRYVAEQLGLFVMEGPEALRAEIQKLQEEEGRVRAERKQRLAFLKALEAQR